MKALKITYVISQSDRWRCASEQSLWPSTEEATRNAVRDPAQNTDTFGNI